MPAARRLVTACAVLALGLGSTGCTLVKPVAGAVTGPLYMLGAIAEGGGLHCGCHEDPRAWCAFFAVGSVVGAAAGFVTGIASDIQWLLGEVDDPTVNWWQPFATNASRPAW